MELNGQTDLKSDSHPLIMEGLEESPIQKMFSGSTVFLTGGTGFLGKLLVEKLLRSCPKIKKLYLLTRPKKNKDVMKRLQEQFDDLLYDKLRKEMPDFIEKISIVEGDMSQINLGISDADRSKLTQEVEFIFHGAATVRFDEALKTAVEINVRGTREILQLARACTKLRAHVHVSTAYSNCHLSEIDEKFYESNLSGDKLIDLVENIDENTLNDITQGLLGDFPNTYAYTKSAAEDIVQKHSQGLPIAVVRPSIVISTVSEPVPGWIDNVYGPTGVVVGAAAGLLHALHCNSKVTADLVPGDYVVNGVIAAAWKTAKDYPGNYEHAPVENLPVVYNYVSSEQNPLTWAKFMNYSEIYGFKVQSMQAVWMYLFWLTPSKFMYNLYVLLMHWIPAYIVDTIAVLIGKKPIPFEMFPLLDMVLPSIRGDQAIVHHAGYFETLLVSLKHVGFLTMFSFIVRLKKAYKKIAKFSEVISFFALREWKFHNKNTLQLQKELDDVDRQIFNFDIENLKWSEYFKDYVAGVRLYLLKDPLETIPQAQKKHIKLMCIHYFLVSLLAFGLLRLIWFLVKLFL